MSVHAKPFAQGRFEELPALPRVPHPYFAIADRFVTVEHASFRQPFRARVKVHGNGPPLFLLHGLMTSSYSWRYVFARLGNRFTCYAPDLPGNGDTEYVGDTALTPARMTAFLGAVVDALGVRGCACIGNSMGGFLTMKAALTDATMFSRLCVLHAPAVPLPRYRALSLALSIPGSLALLRSLVQRSPERWTHKNVHYYDESLKSLEEAREYARPLMTSSGVRAFYSHMKDSISARELALFADELAARRDRGESFPIPLQLVYAPYDPIVPAVTGPTLRALIPDAHYVELAEASHFAHVDATDRFLDVAMPFLTGS